jgi:hypothetical protein
VIEDEAHSFPHSNCGTPTEGASLAQGLRGSVRDGQTGSGSAPRFGSTNRKLGEYIGFGQILFYLYASNFDHSIVLDIDGSVIEEDGGRFCLSSGIVRLPDDSGTTT